MTQARDKANIPVLNFASKGIDDNATSTAITIDSSERVGIGTTSPDYTLSIEKNNGPQLSFRDTSGGTDSKVWLMSGLDSDFRLQALSDNLGAGEIASVITRSGATVQTHQFYTEDSERMRLTTTGLALKTSAPAVTLDVRATSFTPYNTNTSLIVEAPAVFSQSQHFYMYNAGAYNSSRPTGGIGSVNASSLISLSAGSICNGNPGADGFKATATTSSLYDIGSGNHEFKTKTGLTVGDQFTHQTRMIIKDSGNVGIGTTNPQEQLDISSNSPRIRFSDTSVTDLHHKIGSEANDLEISCDAGNDQASSHIGFKVDGSEKVRISDAGNVGIGTSAPDSKLHVVNTGGQAARIHSDTNNSGDLGMSVLAGLDTASSSGDCKWVRLADGNNSGKAYIQFKSSSPNAEFAAISDERLKTNIQDTDVVGLDVINNLRLVKFDWNETATQDAGWSMTGHQKLGFVAQEVEAIVPEFISEDTNGFKIMGDSGFVPYLIKAMQEQQTKIQELEARITTLETNNP